MKKFLSLILALVLAFSMTSCSLFGNHEEEVSETAESFMDALISLEFDRLGEYVSDTENLPAEIAELDTASEFQKVLASLPAELSAYTADFEKLFDEIFGKLKGGFSYEIKNIEREDRDEYTVTVALTAPDLDDVDFDAIFSNTVNENVLSNIALQMISEGKITSSSSEQEVMNLLMPEIIKLMGEAISNIRFDVSTEEKELVVVRTDDGEWLIDVEKSDF